MTARTVDFLHPQRTPWRGWVMLAVGSIAAAVSIGFQQRWEAERAQRDAMLRALEAAAQQARLAAQRPLPATPDEQRLKRIASQLRQPWLPVLRAIENATQQPVFLLSLSIDPASGAIRLDGEAPTFDQALGYAQALDEPGLLEPAQLRSHEQTTDPTGREAVRFSIVTRWIVR